MTCRDTTPFHPARTQRIVNERKGLGPTAHLLHGFVGAGKTTFARQLENETGAIRFTPDEWMHRLYGPNPPEDTFDEHWQKVTDLIWSIADRLLQAGNDVILDFGFWTRHARDEARARVLRSGALPRLYEITCPETVMRKRVRERSENPPPDSLWINEEAFDRFKSRFEPLAEDEERTTVSGTVDPA